jgi:hypothetical protein
MNDVILQDHPPTSNLNIRHARITDCRKLKKYELRLASIFEMKLNIYLFIEICTEAVPA